MEKRYHISNKQLTRFIEAPFSVMGLQFLQKCRGCTPGFKHQRIKEILQAHPSKVKVMQLVDYTN